MKKIIIPLPGIKDTNGAFIKPPAGPKKSRDPKPSDISLDDLLQKHLLLLYRETRVLLEQSMESSGLNKDDSLKMRENARLIMELKKRQKELLDDMSDEDLEKAASR